MSDQYSPSGSDDLFYTNLPSLNINSIQSTIHTSPVSPDEMVIRSRGRRRYPSSFSPDRLPPTTNLHSNPRNSSEEGSFYGLDFNSRGRSVDSHKKVAEGHKYLSGNQPSTERVRRQLEFPPEEDFSIMKLLPVKKEATSPEKGELKVGSNSAKKLKMNLNNNNHATICNQTSPLQLAKGLSKSQLLDLLGTLTSNSPDLSAKLSEVLPKPDLSGFVNNLTSLNRNVYKALPTNRLSNRKDALTYKRVATHLTVFKKSLVGDLVMLEEAGQWGSEVEYVVLVWDIVRSLPVWDNPVHNTTRSACFKYMASMVTRMIKQRKEVIDAKKRKRLMEVMDGSSIGEVQHCQRMLQELSEDETLTISI